MSDELLKAMGILGRVPAGTIVPWGGHIDDSDAERANPKSVFNLLRSRGWRFCNGDTLDPSDGDLRTAEEYRNLLPLIGTYWGKSGDLDGPNLRLPDLRGYFVRGATVDPNRDAEWDKRRKESHDGATYNDPEKPRVGSYQPCATKLPNSGLSVDPERNHHHSVPSVYKEYSLEGPGGAFGLFTKGEGSTEPAGRHDHTLKGGDSETRPINAYVNWIVYTGYSVNE